MTTKTFKQKAPTVQAIEVTDILSQSAEVANLIGSKAFQVDVSAKEATFVLDDSTDIIKIVVAEGRIVSFSEGVPAVRDASDFYAMYEQV